MRGSIDNLTFYISEEYGALVKKKGGPTAEQIRTSDRFEKTRLNNAEFGRAAHYGGRIRTAFTILEQACMNATLNTNLSTRIREIMRMDKESKHGERDLRRDTLIQLRHFELNERNLSKQFFTKPVVTKAENGCLEVTLGITLNKKPPRVYKWHVLSTVACIDFKNENACTCDSKSSELHELTPGEYAMSFTHYFDENKLLFHGLGILFFEYDAVNDRDIVTRQRGVNSGFLRYVPVERVG